jgi:hypothetical protein
MFPGQYTYTFNSMDNALVLSESLDEKAVQTLVDIAIADLFPENCDKWRTTNQGIHARYMQELAKRKDTVHEEIARGEDSLRGVLRDVVVEDVMKIFPYVLICCPEAVRCSRIT